MPDLDLNQLTRAPSWVTVPIIVLLTASLLIGVPLARRAAVKAARLARPDAIPTSQRSRERLAMFAALAPTVLVWLAVMGVSFIGLTGFAADTMQWRHWTNLLVPLSLDGISVSFGGWAFVAVKRGRHPGRSYRIVLAAAATSATLNFVHGKDEWSLWAGAYLAFLSLAGMAMFHEMLDQFIAEYDDEIALKTRYPRFGRRWIWAPVTTFKALRTWIVYPPAADLRPTIHNALAHWRRIEQFDPTERLDQYADDDLPYVNQTGLNGAGIVLKRHFGFEMPQMMTNAEINLAAEDLWIEFMRQGIDLSGAKLLTEFHQRYPHPRGQRWAEYRRKAAQDRLASDKEPAAATAD